MQMSDKILDALNNIASNISDKQLKVGFIDGATYPDGTPVAMVAATNEYGNPANNQPPRPFFRNAIAEHESEWLDAISRGLQKGVPLDDVLAVVGERAVGDVVQSIATLMDPPLSPATIASRKSKGNASTKPLVDTKVMIRDVHYEVGEIEPSQDSQ
nr:MAG TPA: virion morphogenesis protein [Caudoviricetes sp.]